MVDTDVDTITCDFCGETLESTAEESAFEAFTSHFERHHAGDPPSATGGQAERERGAGD